MTTRPRRASVLILVVALLVLMALVATSFLVTARTDRYAARQHTYNARGDMAVESVINLVVSQLVGELFSALNGGSGDIDSRFRRVWEPNLWTGDSLSGIPSPRVPVLADPTAPPTELYPTTPDRPLLPQPGGVNPPLWRSLSQPRYPNYSIGPVWVDGKQRTQGIGGRNSDVYAPTARPFFGRPLWPALQLYTQEHLIGDHEWTANGIYTPWDADPTTPEIDPYPAADTDGDGIADALLINSLTPAPVDGVVYYYAVRVLDHNSAINVNTAMARNFDFDGAGDRADEPLLFKGRIGLAELLRTYNPAAQSLAGLGAEMGRLNGWRINDPDGKLRVAGVRGVKGSDTRVYGRPYDDSGRPRDDFQYLTVGDALERQLAVRLGNPGNARGTLPYRAYGLADEMALAYRFCLSNNGVNHSQLEEDLRESLMLTRNSTRGRGPVGVPGEPYSPEQTTDWMERFRYDLEDPARPAETYRDRRALLVTRNPTSNFSPTIMSPTEWDQWKKGGFGGPPLPAFDGPRPLTYQAKVCINSAPFDELWRGFYSVMRSIPPGPSSSYPNDPRNPIIDPFYGMKFNPATFEPIVQIHPLLMFRSSVRDGRATFFGRMASSLPVYNQSWPMALLRSAIAAVNAEDLRDPDDTVTARTVMLPLFLGGTQANVPVRVFGTERQPFITEVYVNTDTRPLGPGDLANPEGYVAIELHNPYDVAINLGPPEIGSTASLHGWSVGMVDRKPGSTQRRKVVNLDGSLSGAANPPWRFPYGTVVPPRGYLVLENYDPNPEGELDAADPRARYRPAAVTEAGALPAVGLPGADKASKVVYVPNLHRVLAGLTPTAGGGEFVLLRTRRADGLAVDAAALPADPYNEQLNLHDLIPVDQFDFQGVKRGETIVVTPPGQPTQTASVFYAVHYVRANDPAAEPSGAWRFVYPGRYDGTRTSQRHQGMEVLKFQPPAFESDSGRFSTPIRLGLPDATCHPKQSSVPIQVGGLTDWPGPGRPGAPGTEKPNRPFGLFAREGDILQVPFIGAYTVFALPAPGKPKDVDLYEMNSLSMDSAMAEDTDPYDDWSRNLTQPNLFTNREPFEQYEQIGRFCPVKVRVPDPDLGTSKFPDKYKFIDDHYGNWSGAIAATYPWSDITRDYKDTRVFFRYRWCKDLFDYFTVESPDTDYLPNVPPSLYKTPTGQPAGDAPVPVSNSGGRPGNKDPSDPDGNANDQAEVSQPIEGRININTAPWRVLAALPLVVDPKTGKVDVVRTEELAKAIVYYRDVDDGFRWDSTDVRLNPHGPFWSIFDLNAVVDRRPASMRRPGFTDMTKEFSFRNGYGTLDPSGLRRGDDPGTPAGDLSPYHPGKANKTDGVRGDFEEQFLTLTRISSLITTHSDSFTCYVYVAGVRHAGTPDAELVVQRRVACIIDRSTVTPDRPIARVQRFSQE